MKNSEQSAFGYGFANEQSHQEVRGLSKREYFACLAMQGLLSNSYGAMTEGGGRTFSPDRISELALIHADSLLEKLSEES